MVIDISDDETNVVDISDEEINVVDTLITPSEAEYIISIDPWLYK